MEHLIFVMHEVICDIKLLVQWFITSDQSELNLFIKIIVRTFRSEYFFKIHNTKYNFQINYVINLSH